MLGQDYNEKCDIWSCGIILYIMLVGYPPFNGTDEQQILDQVAHAELQFDEDDWVNISPEARTLVTKMLVKDPKDRISAEEAYNDKWIQNNSSKQKLSQKVLKNLG